MISIDLARIVPCETHKTHDPLPNARRHQNRTQHNVKTPTPPFSRLDLHCAQNHAAVSARRPRPITPSNTPLKHCDSAFPLDAFARARNRRYNDYRSICNADHANRPRQTDGVSRHARIQTQKPLFDSEPSPQYIQPRFWSKQSPIPNSNITRPSAYKGNSDRRV